METFNLKIYYCKQLLFEIIYGGNYIMAVKMYVSLLMNAE
jgi:hypothetical protein